MSRQFAVKKTFLCIILASLLITASPVYGKPEEISYTEFLEMVKDDEVESINWSDEDADITFADRDGNEYTTDNPRYEDFKKDMLELGIEVNEGGFFERYSDYIMLAFQLLSYVFMAALLLHITGNGKGPWKKKNKIPKESVKFSDVAGLDEVKEDLITVVDFLKNPKKYKDAGAETPRGILLYGPPGTGKTLLAKAIAGEAGVKFIATTGSDFDEKYVGVGASRMRKMFETAKQNAPCIIFVDEIDSLGGKRNSKQSNTDRQTLNSFLSEMDGFDSASGVIVMAATNRLEDLDPALTRPGRFDSHYAVGLPETPQERRKVIDLYAADKKFSEDVDFDVFAKEISGSSPAMVKAILNDAAIMSVKDNNGIITQKILDEAWMKQLIQGHLKKDGAQDNRKITARHEAGHALIGLLCGQDLTKVSVIPSTSGVGGATFIVPEKTGLLSRHDLEVQACVLYGGRCAELLLSGDEDAVTTGASNDIERATEIIREMITEYGMDDDCGLLNLEVLDADPEIILNRAKEISKKINEKTMNLLKENLDTLKRIADELELKETLTGEEVRKIAEASSVKAETE